MVGVEGTGAVQRGNMIVKCKTDKAECPMIQYCIARLNDPTITGCGIPLWDAGLIRKEEIMVEHTVKGETWSNT